jgi:hypothetical protein
MSLRRLEADAWSFARDVTNNAVSALVDAHQQEQARRRCESCTDAVFHERMLATLPRWRLPAIWRHRRRLRKARAWCDALRQAGDLVAISICAGAKGTTQQGRA